MNASEMRAKLRQIEADFPERIGAALFQEGQIEMTEAKRRTPVSPLPARNGVVPGTLRASGTVHEPDYSGKHVSVTLSFGGAAEDYAIVQHERLDYHHTTGQAKYLESVLNESRQYMLARLARRLHLGKK